MFDSIVKAIEKAAREQQLRASQGASAAEYEQRLLQMSQPPAPVQPPASRPTPRPPAPRKKGPGGQRSKAGPPQAVPANEQAARRDTTSVGASAGAIAGWARPATLRSQFILTEILKPPLSLRKDR